MIIDAKKAEAVEQDQKWIDGEKFDTIIISKAQFQQFKENGQVEIESPIFAYTEGKGILSKDRLVQKPGEAWGHIWLGMPIEFIEEAEIIPIDFLMLWLVRRQSF